MLSLLMLRDNTKQWLWMIAQLESVRQFLNFIHYFEGIFENNIIDLFMKTHSKN